MDEGGTCPSNDIASETGSTSEHTYSNGEHTCSNGEHTCSNGERLHTDPEATNVKETEKEQNDLERNNLIGMDADSISISSQAVTSTPVRGELVKGNVRFEADSMSVSDTISRDSLSSRDSLNPEQIRVPIQGFEIMEERAKFTVFKIKVEKSERDSWFVFRRYTDFVQLNEKLKRKFPNVRLSLPPKRWFKDNFDKNFIEDRLLGLQVFVDNCTIHKDICNSRPVREFFCFDDPPGPHDSLEESRALCESLEESVYRLRKELSEKDAEVVLLHEELDLYKRQVEMLSQALREKNAGGRSLESPASAGGTSLTSEFDLSTCPEADQSCLQVDNESEISSIVKEQDVKEDQASQENIKEDKSKKKTSTSQASKKKFSMFKSKSSKAASTSVES